ncbi:MAG: FHA domain-containing protein [Verrucomicrobia bacterium]|nr:FHA domain-containing protein [Verrucomicrobiota bacterium]
MGRLHILTAGIEPAVLELPAGTTTLGRREDNPLRLSDDSVSSRHCELTEADGRLTIRDLGSTNGTFINGERVEQGIVTPGATFKLGSVELRFEVDAPSPAPAPEAPKLSLGSRSPQVVPPAPAGAAPPPPLTTAPLAKGVKACARHPATAAQYICPKCRTHSCDACVKAHESVSKRTVFCPVCATKALPLAEFAQIQGERQVREDLAFHQQIKGVFKYPFSKGGLAMLIIGTLLFFGLDFLVTWGWKMRFIMLKVLGYVGIVALFSAGYLCAYLQKILFATAQGEDDVPGWPEFSQWWDDIVVPFRLVIVACIASFGPAFAYMGFHVGNDSEMSLTILFPLFALGFLYFPMALLAAAMSNSCFAVNPLVVLPAITRLNLQYALACAVFFALVLVRFLSETLLHAVLPIPVLPTLLSSFVALYFLAVEVRLLGLLYYTNRRQLGWFSS